MLARDIEKELRVRGQEKGIYTILHRLAEECEDNKRAIRDLAVLIDKLTTVMMMQDHVMTAVKTTIDKHFKRDDDERSTHEMVRSVDPDKDD